MKRSATPSLGFVLSASLCSLIACGGGVVQEQTSDGGEGAEGTPPTTDGGTADATTTGPSDSGVLGYDVSVGPNGEGGHSGDDASGNSGEDAGGGAPVDAGYYYGDGSFWVEGGAYPPPSDASTGEGAEAGLLDASPGCQPLAACCGSLSGSLQSLCDSIAESGNASNCATELGQLQTAGNCNGVAVLANQVQVMPTRLVSDGTLLFWTTGGTPGLLAMPVQGGPITVLLDASVGFQNPSRFGPSYLLVVDDTNVYVTQGSSLVRIPKNGSPPTLVNQSGANVIAATTLGATAYWMGDDESNGDYLTFGSASLLGGPISTIAAFNFSGGPTYMAVTSSTTFFGYQVQQLLDFPMSGVPSGGPPNVAAGVNCEFITSDTDAIYCAQQSGSNLRIANDGTATSLGSAVDSSTIVFDDTYVYWADMTTVGTIMKAPKAGGGSATVLATDTSPTAIAVDANSVYWSDQEGYIKSVPK